MGTSMLGESAMHYVWMAIAVCGTLGVVLLRLLDPAHAAGSAPTYFFLMVMILYVCVKITVYRFDRVIAAMNLGAAAIALLLIAHTYFDGQHARAAQNCFTVAICATQLGLYVLPPGNRWFLGMATVLAATALVLAGFGAGLPSTLPPVLPAVAATLLFVTNALLAWHRADAAFVPFYDNAIELCELDPLVLGDTNVKQA